MSDNTSYSGIPSREEIQNMSTPELMEFLKLESNKSSNSSQDTELICYILEVLETREDAQDSAPKHTPEEAFEKFRELYLAPVEAIDPIDEAEELPRDRKRQASRFPKWLRSAAAAAAVLAAVVIAGSVTIKAAGIDPGTMFANWTKDIFFFNSPDDSSSGIYAPDMADLEQSIEDNDIAFLCIPHWLPEGYRLFDVYTSVTPRNTLVTAEFINGTEKIILLLRSSSSNPNPGISEKDNSDVELFVYEGCTYYLFTNNDIASASWLVDNWECSLYGPISMDDLKHIISSFYESK